MAVTGDGGKLDRDERFLAAMARFVAVLPFGLDDLLAPTFLGFALINGLTFSLDLLLLTILRSGLEFPLTIAFTLSYLTAFALSFALNRSLNFRSHAPVGRQLVLYIAAIGVNSWGSRTLSVVRGLDGEAAGRVGFSSVGGRACCGRLFTWSPAACLR